MEIINNIRSNSGKMEKIDSPEIRLIKGLSLKFYINNKFLNNKNKCNLLIFFI